VIRGARACLVLSCLWTLGCAPLEDTRPFPETVQSDPSIAHLTQSAVTRWRVATGIPLRMLVSGAEIRVRHAECPGAPDAAGCAPDRIVYAREATELVITHELGHVLGGPGHVSEEGDAARGVMHYSVESEGCITQIDLDWLCSRAACRWRVPECD